MKQFFALLILLVTILLPSLAVDTTPDYVGFHLQEANRLRTELGLPPFTYNNQLAQAASVQAEWMIRNWSYTHYHGGSTPTTRALAAGYTDYDWCCTENTFLSPTVTPEAAMHFWMNSRPHYRQLMSTEYDEIGVGFAIGSERTAQVIVFGTHRKPNSEVVETAPVAQPVNMNNASTVPSTTCAITHTVQTGENLFRIGLRYGFSANQLASYNSISNVALIYVGQRLCIPPNGNPAGTTAGVPSAPAAASSVLSDDNWCYAGNPWGDGRCNRPDDPAAQEYMWQCGWYKAHGIARDGCGI